jgi:hypothetical protein
VAADGAVARWQDISGNARHVTQGTSSARPVRKTGIQNGLAVVRFDGSNDFMSVASSTATFKFLHGSDHTLFFVVKPRALNTREFLFETGPHGSPSGDIGSLGASCFFNTTGSVSHLSRAGTTPEVSNTTSTGTVAAGTCYVVSIVAQPSNGTASLRSSIRINGSSAIANNTQTDSVSSSNARLDLTFGRGTGYNGDGSEEYEQCSDFDYCEVIMYNSALSSTDRAAVENYLTNKWGIPISPFPREGLQLWLDAADASTLYDATTGGSLVAADGGVARWEDKSGNARHFTQSVSNNRPTRKTNQQNGYGTLLFDGSNDQLVGADYLDANSGGLTVIIVYKRNATGAKHILIAKGDENNNGNGWYFSHDSANKLSCEAQVDANNYMSRSTSSTVTASSYVVATMVCGAGAFQSASMYRNGSSLSMDSASVGGSGAQQPPNTSVAVTVSGWVYNGGPYEAANVNIAEIIVYSSALSETDRAAVESYLISKWGIS